MTGDSGSEIAVILLDENGTIVDAHATCFDTFGWQRAELVGKDVRELLQYGRDLLMSQLQVLEDEGSGNTSFSIRVLAKRKDQAQFPARATVRRFRELECWTVAFYRADSESVDTQVTPVVSPEEIALAKKAMEEGTVRASQKNKKQKEEKKGEGMSVSRLWRNSRLLFSSREDKPSENEAGAPEQEFVEEEVARDSTALAKQVAQAVAPAPAVAPVPVKAPAVVPAGAPVPPSPAPVAVAPAPNPVAAAPIAAKAPSAPAPVPVAVVEQKAPSIPAPVQPSPARHESPSEALPSLARLKAELEKERGERTRIEQRCASLNAQVQSLHLQLSESLNLEQETSSRIADLERDLRESKEAAILAKAELESERRDRQAAEEHLSITRELNTRLEQNFAQSDKRAATYESAQHELRVQIERAAANLREAEANLDKEREARQTAENMLAAALRDHREFEHKTVGELSILKSLLEAAELEKNRGQEHVLRARAEAIEAIRGSRVRVQQFRKSFGQVLEHINGTTSELLQSNLSDEQKCVIEALLQDVISLQATLEKEEPEAVAK